jgi:hypothetical protein
MGLPIPLCHDRGRGAQNLRSFFETSHGVEPLSKVSVDVSSARRSNTVQPVEQRSAKRVRYNFGY